MMSETESVILVVFLGPLVGLTGMILLGRPHEVFRLTVLVARFEMRLFGFNSTVRDGSPRDGQGSVPQPGSIWDSLDRACERPQDFWLPVLLCRLIGAFCLVLSILFVASGVVAFVNGP